MEPHVRQEEEEGSPDSRPLMSHTAGRNRTGVSRLALLAAGGRPSLAAAAAVEYPAPDRPGVMKFEVPLEGTGVLKVYAHTSEQRDCHKLWLGGRTVAQRLVAEFARELERLAA